jgi:hypothetical protein
MIDTDVWTCPSCDTTVRTPFCPACGEGRPRAHELTLRGLLGQGVKAFTKLDARLLRSVRSLLRRPGALTLVYLNGPRKPYIGPFALFLLAGSCFC